MGSIVNLINQFGGWDVLVGFVAPLVLAVIYKAHWSTQLKTNATWVAAIVTGIGTTFFAGKFTGSWNDLGAVIFNIGLILTATSVSHDKFWRPTGIADAIEVATTPKNATAPVVK